MNFLKALYAIIKNPHIIDQMESKYNRLYKNYDSLDKDMAVLCDKIGYYEQCIETGYLLEVPDKITGDVIYYVTEGSVPSEKLLKHVVSTVYNSTTYYIIRITVDHFIIKNNMVYIAIDEDQDITIYSQDPMLFDTFDMALKYISKNNEIHIDSDTITEYKGIKSATIKANSFTFPCRIGTTVYNVLYINDIPRIMSEYIVIGFVVKSDNVQVILYSEDEADLQYVRVGCSGFIDDSWTFTKPN